VRPSFVVPSSLSPLYEGSRIDPLHPIQSAYPSPYANSTSYSSSPPPTNPHSYSPISPATSPMNYAQARPGHFIPRPQSTMPHSIYSRSIARPQYTHSSSHSHSNSYSQSPTWPSHSMYPTQEWPNRAPSPAISCIAPHMPSRPSQSGPLFSPHCSTTLTNIMIKGKGITITGGQFTNVGGDYWPDHTYDIKELTKGSKYPKNIQERKRKKKNSKRKKRRGISQHPSSSARPLNSCPQEITACPSDALASA